MDDVGDDVVPTAIAKQMAALKHALSRTSDAVLSCSRPSVAPSELQNRLAQVLHANAPEPPPNTPIAKDDPAYEEHNGQYGHNLRIEVSRSKELVGIVTVAFSMNIECGTDSVLLVYELRDGGWIRELRWQSPPLKMVSDAFGDFFAFAFVKADSTADSGPSHWQLAVAHGRPWCTSRFSGFRIDLLSPTHDPGSPQVMWHMERGYSRGDFVPTLKSWGNTFELRINADCTSFDSEKCFERRVIYRYAVDGEDHARRVGPLALNARGFVSEWLRAPWSEAQEFSTQESAVELREVHETFDPPAKENEDHYTTTSYGPVLACAAANTFQVQMKSTLEKIVPGKPGGEQQPLPSRYFQVREVKNGYIVLSAPTKPDPTCSGPNLMPDTAK